MNRQWILKPEPDISLITRLAEEINVSKPIANILLSRNIKTLQEAKAFFRPDLQQLHDPMLMKDMDKAVERLIKAIEKQEKIMLYGDYDVDGTTSVAMCFSFFRDFYPHVIYYIPDRYAEGYGVSQKGIDYALQQGIELIITLDCGIKAVDKIQYAQTRQIDCIVCDHHKPGAALPPAYAVLDPKRKDCHYPFGELSGCGVGFKLLQAFCRKQRIAKEQLFKLLDFLAISIACDIVPINGENRILSKYGLDIINDKPRTGIEHLKQAAGFTKKLTTANLVFGFGPRINAAGRIDHARNAVELLIAGKKQDAQKRADELNKKNQERKDYESLTTQQALEIIKGNGLESQKTTVLFKPNWHKGVVGIVASRCIEKYYRPTIILTESKGKATGSARSVDGFDIYEAISACEDLIEQYGGHRYAAGLTMDIANIPAFQQRFEQVVSSTITTEQLIPKIYIDTVTPLCCINERFYNILRQMAPFGPANMQPVFLSKNVVVSNAKILKDKHLKFSVSQLGSNTTLSAIAFGLVGHYNLLVSGKSLNLCYTIEENNFMDKTSLQLVIKDIRFAHE